MKGFILGLILVLSPGLLGAQTITWKLGDPALEVSLNDIQVKAKADLPTFQAEVQLDFGIKPADQVKLITENGITPAELYLACQLGKQSKKGHAAVLADFKKNKGKGWGFVAMNLGVKPGSAAFKAMKDQTGAKAQKLKEKGGPKNKK